MQIILSEALIEGQILNDNRLFHIPLNKYGTSNEVDNYLGKYTYKIYPS